MYGFEIISIALSGLLPPSVRLAWLQRYDIGGYPQHAGRPFQRTSIYSSTVTQSTVFVPARVRVCVCAGEKLVKEKVKKKKVTESTT